MKRSLSFLPFIFIALTFCACHKSYYVKGTIRDKSTDKPIYGASVQLKKIDTAITDSLGSFEFKKYLTGGYAFTEVEILVEKEGFKSRYLNISKHYNGSGDLNVYLERGLSTNSLPQEGVKLFYFINLAISGINLITILFILFNRIRRKLLWIAGIIFMNCVFNIIYIDGSIDFHFFHGPFFIVHYVYSPFTIILAIPIVTISFWILYVTMLRKKIIRQPNKK